MHLVEKATAAIGRDGAAARGLDADVERLAAILRQIALRADDLIATVRKSGGGRYQDSVRRLERQLRRTQADLNQLEAGLCSEPVERCVRSTAQRTTTLMPPPPPAC